jgi:hypothetical protein
MTRPLKGGIKKWCWIVGNALGGYNCRDKACLVSTEGGQLAFLRNEPKNVIIAFQSSALRMVFAISFKTSGFIT